MAMHAARIDGKGTAAQMRKELQTEVQALESEGVTPGLAVVLVGENAASQVYVRMKQKACREVGIYSKEHRLSESITQVELLDLVDALNADPDIHGILVQLPLPGGLDEQEVLCRIDPDKDVDGFHPINVGRLSVGAPGYAPCTPAGIMELLRRTGVEIEGKKAVVLGRSNIVGKPTAMLLLGEHATVEICHSRTRDVAAACRTADILVAAVGRPEMVRGDWIKPGAVVIDVGINRTDAGLIGDVAYEEAAAHASAITPVPGGVGPMTIAMLLSNTVHAAKRTAGLV